MHYTLAFMVTFLHQLNSFTVIATNTSRRVVSLHDFLSVFWKNLGGVLMSHLIILFVVCADCLTVLQM